MVAMTYIAKFLERVEGSFTVGYIPCYVKTGGTANYKGGPKPENYRAMGVSGVTIGVGCDLGQTTEATLVGFGLDPELAALFRPYYGKRKDAAIAALHERPLRITEERALALSEAVHRGYLEKYVIPAYDRDSRVPFTDLPQEAQAVVMSVCYQKGCGGVRRDWPKTWRYLTTQDWAAASRELKTGFTQYTARRKTEGQLLEALF